MAHLSCSQRLLALTLCAALTACGGSDPRPPVGGAGKGAHGGKGGYAGALTAGKAGAGEGGVGGAGEGGEAGSGAHAGDGAQGGVGGEAGVGGAAALGGVGGLAGVGGMGASAGNGGDPCAGIDCSGHGLCTVTVAGASCSCNPGYALSVSDRLACVDIDECALDAGGCDRLTACTNLPGTHTCSECPRGYTGTGDTACVAKTCNGAPDADCACIKVTPDGDDAAALASHGALPFHDVTLAIDFAAANPDVATKVCVAGGPLCSSVATYPGPEGADLAMQNGISVYGKYETTGFTRCATTHLSLTSATGVLFDASVQSETTLDGFRLMRFAGPTSTGVTIRGASGVRLSGIDIDGADGAVNVFGVDLSDGAHASLNDVHIVTAGSPYQPTGDNYGIRSVGSVVQIDSGSAVLHTSGGHAYGIWLENSPGSSVDGHAIEIDLGTGLRLQGGGVAVGELAIKLAGRNSYGVGTSYGVDLVDAGQIVLTGSLTIGPGPSGVAPPSDAYGIRALRSRVDLEMPVTLLQAGHATAVLLDSSPGSKVSTTITGSGGSLAGILITGDATGIEINDTSVELTSTYGNESALAFTDCGGASPRVTGSSFTAVSGIRTTSEPLDAVSSFGDCHPEFVGNGAIVSAATGDNGSRTLNAVHCGDGSRCDIIDTEDIHVENRTPPQLHGTWTTAAGIRCEAASCGVIVGNHVTGLASSPGCQRNCAYRGGGIFSSGNLVARNWVSAGCTGDGAGITANGGRIENNHVFGPGCGASNLDYVSKGAALVGGTDVHSNTLIGRAAQDYVPQAYELYYGCSSAGARGSGSYRNNVITTESSCYVLPTWGTTYGCSSADVPGNCSAALWASSLWGLFENNQLGPGNLFMDGQQLFTSIDAVNLFPSAAGNISSSDPAALIDAGTTTGAPLDDIDGELRDSQPDIGADEVDGTPRPNPCTGVECSGHGTCMPLGSFAECVCEPGYLGLDCSFPDECFANNGGCDPLVTCTAFPGTHTCGACPPGYLGSGDSGCFLPGCAGNPCQHGGTCLDGPDGTYTCTCPPTITGAACDIVFTNVVAGRGFTCGLRSDGQILCWGDNSLGQTDSPSGSFLALSTGSLGGCAVRTNGTLACWGFSNQGVTSPPDGTFQTLSITSDYACALNGNTPTCWGGVPPPPPPPNAAFTSIELGAWHRCGILVDGTVTCWGLEDGLNDHGQAIAPPGTFVALALASTTSCGVRQGDGGIECWGAEGFGGAEPPSGAFQALDVNSLTGCALRTTGDIACWGESVVSGAPTGTFKTISLGDFHACAIRSDDTVACWGNDSNGALTPPH